MKNRKNRNKYFLIICVILIVISICAIAIAYKNHKDYMRISNNTYNMAFYQLVEYMQDVENYLLKSVLTNDAEQSSKTLTYIWREANLAGVYLSQIPISNEGLSNTQKFLNQASEYSYTLSNKSLRGNDLENAELLNLKELYNYSKEVNNTLNQIMLEINSGTLSWKELEEDGSSMFSKEISNMSQDSFKSIEETFKEYDGLIYDGAYSEHITNKEKKGLIGEEIDEENSKKIARDFIGEDKIRNITSSELSENGDIKAYTFELITNNDENIVISVSKKGGHIIFMNYNRNVEEEKITVEEAYEKALEFLNNREIENMKKTYYIKEGGIITINYAYEENDVIVYPDLIKVKVALDNGEILGIETTGYLNNHEKRNINKRGIITKEQALKVVSNDLEIENGRLAIIPTEYETEEFCWELKGRIEDREFLIYVDVKTGKVDDVLVILKSENGIIIG